MSGKYIRKVFWILGIFCVFLGGGQANMFIVKNFIEIVRKICKLVYMLYFILTTRKPSLRQLFTYPTETQKGGFLGRRV